MLMEVDEAYYTEFYREQRREKYLRERAIEKGDIYGIIGMSGAGKSTLVRCLNFLERPTDGQILVDGKDLGSLTEKELRKERSDIAMIFQHFNLLMQKNVLDNVCFPLRLQGIKKQEARQKARELLEIVGLSEKEKASIVLHYFEDRSIKEISSILQIPQGTVKYYLSTGRNHLLFYSC